MKKVLLAATVAVMATTVSAEEAPSGAPAAGGKFISGSIGFSSSGTKDNKASTFTLTPEFTYLLSDKTGIGVYLNVDNGPAELPYPLELPDGAELENVTSLGFGAYGRYYFTNIRGFYIYGQAGLGLSIPGESQLEFGINLHPGIQYFLSNRFSASVSLPNLFNLSYGSYGEGDLAYSNLGLNLGTGSVSTMLNFSFSVHF
jgi:opacity protein-like surface antigen